MNRKLILIVNDGGSSNFLPGVSKDQERYCEFFQSDEGGAWEKDEIKVFPKPTKQFLHTNILLYREMLVEYLLIVFCGHGYSNNHGERYLELSRNEDLSLSELKVWTNFMRCLLITDCCSNLIRLDEGGKIPTLSTFSSTENHKMEYRSLCKEMYNNTISKSPINSSTAGFATTLNESANEDELGGFYSNSLLQCSENLIIERKGRQMYLKGGEEIVSFTCVHQLAAEEVKKKSCQNQNPVCITHRGAQYPFIVVPNLQCLFP